MKILGISITNFRGISDTTTISFNDFCCIVGKNDAGKSTILKALDLFLNESAIRKEDKNIHTQNDIMKNHDFTAFDEIQTIIFQEPAEIQAALKSYLESGKTTIDNNEFSSE